MYDLVRKDVAIDTKEPSAGLALVPPRLGHAGVFVGVWFHKGWEGVLIGYGRFFAIPFFVLSARCCVLLLLWWRGRGSYRKGRETAEAGRLVGRCLGVGPGDFAPVTEGEEVVVTAR